MKRIPLTDLEKQQPYAHFYDRDSAEIPAPVLESIQQQTHDPAKILRWIGNEKPFLDG